MTRLVRYLPLAAVALTLNAAPSFALEGNAPDLQGFWLTTPYPELAVRPGKKESIPLTLRNANMPPQRAEITVSGIPDGWTWELKGGSRDVSAAMVQPNDSEHLSLEVTAPASAGDKEVSVKIAARYGDQTTTLPMTVRVDKAAAAGVKLTPNLPALRGTPKSTFTYKVKVENDGSEDALYNLAAQVPDGFQTRFKQGYGSEEITGLPVKAGETTDLTFEVVPPRSVDAGRYPVALQVSDGDSKAATQLSLEVTGQPAISLVGPQDRLSGKAVAGKDASYNFTILNTGSAPVGDIGFSASPPQGWKVTFAPDKIPSLAPDAKQEVNVTFRPSERAIAGDYMVALNANAGGGTSDKAEFRVTVETATAWGMAGLGIIAAAVVILGMAVMRYGRR